MTIQNFEFLRRSVLGATALVCLCYAVGVFVTGRPDPMPFWVPGGFGLGAAFLIALGAMANPRSASAATDEGYFADWGRAQRHAYWVAIALYPLFAVFMALDWVDFGEAFAAMGTLTGGSVLAFFVAYDLKGR